MSQLATLLLSVSWRLSALAFALIMCVVAPTFWLLVRDHPLPLAGPSVGAGATEATEDDSEHLSMMAAQTTAGSDEATQEDLALTPTSGSADRTEKKQQGIGLLVEVQSLRFWLTTLCVVSAYWTYPSVLSQLIPALIAEGFSRQDATNALSLMTVCAVCSKIACGYISEKLTARLTLVCYLLVECVGLVAFALSGARWSYWASMAVFGFGFGGVGALLPLTVIETYGRQDFGSVYGFVSVFNIIPCIVGPLAAGQSYDHTGSYKNAFLFAVAVFMFSCLCLLLQFWLTKPVGSPCGTEERHISEDQSEEEEQRTTASNGTRNSLSPELS